jgi:glycosyltransferase involved in cell wall biosynthesis
VIVPVRNGREDVRALVEKLEAQTLPREQFELVIGDDGSTDGTCDGLEASADWIRVAAGRPLNSYAARNRAVRASAGSILAFCDADCRPEPEWLERGLRALESADVVAGRIRFTLPERRTVWTLIDMDGSKNHELIVKQGLAETANLFVRRELFDRVGGFEDEVPEYGDFDFVERTVAAGARLVYDEGPVVWHPTRNQGRPFLRATWIYNRGYAEREGREGRLPEGLKLRSWVPLVQPLRARLRWGRSVGPDRSWLETNGIRPRRAETIKALPIMYLLIPYLRGFAQLSGWRAGKRLRRQAARASAQSKGMQVL